MGLFSKKPHQRAGKAEPVRETQVQRLITALRKERHAILCDGERDFKQAEAVVDSVRRNCTEAEIQEAMRRDINHY